MYHDRRITTSVSRNKYSGSGVELYYKPVPWPTRNETALSFFNETESQKHWNLSFRNNIFSFDALTSAFGKQQFQIVNFVASHGPLFVHCCKVNRAPFRLVVHGWSSPKLNTGGGSVLTAWVWTRQFLSFEPNCDWSPQISINSTQCFRMHCMLSRRPHSTHIQCILRHTGLFLQPVLWDWVQSLFGAG